jgi:hypothetical protein
LPDSPRKNQKQSLTYLPKIYSSALLIKT